MEFQTPTASVEHDLARRVQQLERQLSEAHQREAATTEVLKVISRSALDVQCVLDTLVKSAARLCDAYDAAILQLDGDVLRLAAHHGQIAFPGPIPVTRGTLSGRAFIERRTIHVADVQAEPDEYPDSHERALRSGWHTALSVPLARGDEAIGVILIRRADVRPFGDREVELVETFADQALIAIENARLFAEVQQKNYALTEAHAQVSGAFERETATSEILRVIGSSPTDVQPVFETISRSGVNVCGALGCVVLIVDGGMIHVAATHGVRPERLERFHRDYPMPLSTEIDTAQTIRQRSMFHLADIENNPNATAADIENARLAGYRTRLMVPMVRGDRTLGLIAVTREDPTPFPDPVVDLLKTFADQAVIAIENTRLFEEVQTRNRELRISLEQQTATSEILNVISRSPTNVQPVFVAIAESSVRLCGANYGSLIRLEGGVRRRVADYGMTPRWSETASRIFPQNLTNGLIGDVAMLNRSIIHLENIQNDDRFEVSQALARTMGYHTALAVPMLREGAPVGAIVVFRQEERRFSEAEIGLLRTFADQAVIAIENTRLFEEVQSRNRDLTALGEVGRAVSSTLDLKAVLKTIVDRAVELSGTGSGSIFYFREDIGKFELGETTGLSEELVARFRELDIAAGQTGLGEAIARHQPLQVPDVQERASNPLRDAAIEAGLRAALIVPLFSGDRPLGALVLQRRQPGEFAPAVVKLMQSFADQSAIALENARLFAEIAQKSRELEIASQHKSQFVANMSHELRTPLAAILGYAELMQEGFYEALGQKSLDALTRIRANGKHLLSLINTVLDIAKIESGQFTLNMAEYAIEGVVETVRSATESLAQNKKLALKTDVAKSLPIGLGDEQRLTQVLLNLVGNAIKFTDSGEVCVTAKVKNGRFNVSVTDTGPGIPLEHQPRIFEQFHQVDDSNTKAKGGTGLGLAIAKQIVEMHGGRIWVESEPGEGATFQMELPTRADP